MAGRRVFKAIACEGDLILASGEAGGLLEHCLPRMGSRGPSLSHSGRRCVSVGVRVIDAVYFVAKISGCISSF